jgi:hypothetical protein
MVESLADRAADVAAARRRLAEIHAQQRRGDLSYSDFEIAWLCATIRGEA